MMIVITTAITITTCPRSHGHLLCFSKTSIPTTLDGMCVCVCARVCVCLSLSLMLSDAFRKGSAPLRTPSRGCHKAKSGAPL